MGSVPKSTLLRFRNLDSPSSGVEDVISFPREKRHVQGDPCQSDE